MSSSNNGEKSSNSEAKGITHGDNSLASQDHQSLGFLPEHEREILEKQIDQLDTQPSFLKLYRYATRTDLSIIIVSAICSVTAGALLPLMTVIFGQLSGVFQRLFQGRIDQSQFHSDLKKYALYLIYLAIGEFITVYVSTVGWIHTGERISGRFRESYLAAILRQNVGFFDTVGAGEITTRITADANLVQDGISEKVGLTLYSVATFTAAFVIGFVKYWKLTLILTSVVFAISFIMGGGLQFILKFNKNSLSSYAEGGTVAEEVLCSVRNATAFGTQSRLALQYSVHLANAEKWGAKTKFVLAFMLAGMMTLTYLNYGLSFWQGSRYLVSGETNLSSIVTILLSIMISASSLGSIGPWIQAFATAAAAGAKMYATIDRVSPIDSSNRTVGLKPESIQGAIELRNVKHIYPSRPEAVVMDNVSLHIPAGKTTALVGASGSGKSTVIGLIERFYDPVGRSVLLDGRDVRTLNIQWLRQASSLVSQEPVLFATTVYNNIRHGLIGTESEELDEFHVKELVQGAARAANAHDFITLLPEGYDTNVGERGFLMSGGQKQRIAIARAIISDPKILLLDEATSALDTKSEGVVQAALDRASQGRTTVVVAHRLSTIKNADNIVVLSGGRIVEQGVHNDLLETKGAYFRLVEAQRITASMPQSPIDDQIKKGSDSESLLQEKNHDGLSTTHMQSLSAGASSSGELSNTMIGEGPRYSLWILLQFIWKLNQREWRLMVLALSFAIVAGGGIPTQAIFFAEALVALSRPPSQYAQLRHDVDFWSLMYLMLAIVQFMAWTGSMLIFGYCSERLIFRARDQAFRAMLRQDISFFDQEENSAGALTSFLSTKTTNLAGFSGSTLGTVLNTVTTLVAAIALGIAIGWKLGLVCTAVVPVLLACGFLRVWMLAHFEQHSRIVYQKSASYACEATSAIRTVASLTREEEIWQKYHEQIMQQQRNSLMSVLRSSALYAASQSLVFCCTALGFWYGGTLMGAAEYTLFQFFACYSSIIFGAQSAGTIFSFAPDIGKAKQAASELKLLFDRVPEIDSWSTEGEPLRSTEGAIEFQEVFFRYPSRSDQAVLCGLSFVVKPGQYVALVGASGCGKSTTIALLEHFYNPTADGIFIDGKDISKVNLNDYRSHLALVSQEPTLYQGTIGDNILLGTTHDVSEEDIIRACKDANIYEFIMSLPDGLATTCGSKGTLLSGGQKQRIAIARALIRDPKVLLLDEATSALDSESEQVVQAALDGAAKGRTTIAVAHRLSTIRKADVIYVLDGGRIVEKGTHSQLLARGGKYFDLVSSQSLEKLQ